MELRHMINYYNEDRSTGRIPTVLKRTNCVGGNDGSAFFFMVYRAMCSILWARTCHHLD